MIVSTARYTEINQETTEKKCGWLCKITRGAIIAVGTAVGGVIGGAIATAIASYVEFRELNYTNLNFDEQDRLIKWAENKFLPVYERILKRANTIFETNDFAKQVALINEVENHIAVLKAYVKSDFNTFGFSAEAIKEMIDYTDYQMEQIRQLYTDALQDSENVVSTFETTITATKYDITPFMNLSISKLNVLNYGIEKVVTTTDVSGEINATTTNENTTTPTNTITETTEKKGWKWWQILLATSATVKGIQLITKKKK
jgi:hypothetical protein